MDQATPASNLIQPIKARASQSQYRSTSAMLADIVRGSSDPISISTLFERLGDRGFGLALLLFAIPNAIPFPIPGISVITGMPLVELDWPFVARLGGLSACAADRSSLRRGEAAKSLAE
jgi:hypothetical protein